MKKDYTRTEWQVIQNGEKIFNLDKSIFRIEESLIDFTNEDINDIYKSLKRFENILLKELERRI